MGKSWYPNGDIYVGAFSEDEWTQGDWFELKEDGTYGLSKVSEGKRGPEISNEHTDV